MVPWESEFLAHIVLPDGSTVGDHTIPAVAAAYASGTVPAMLPGLPDGGPHQLGTGDPGADAQG